MRERRVLYTVEEAAHLLGISPSTVYRWAREGELRTVQVGGRMVVPASSLEQLLGPADGEPGDSAADSDEYLNEVAIAGRLVADPELRVSRKGLRYATMRLAIRNGGGTREAFHVVVVAFGDRADDVAGLTPGTMIRVDGRLGQRAWTAEDGVRIGAQRIVAERVRTVETTAQVAS
jgi:excisionase family DNA binding protein